MDVETREALAGIRNWQHAHGLEDEKAFQDRPTKEEMKQIVHDALVEFFSSKGKMGKNILVSAAVIMGSFVVIAGGFKWIIGLVGYSILKQ